MKLPNGEHAIVDIVKLRDYALSQHHPRGRHKARVFLSALDLERQTPRNFGPQYWSRQELAMPFGE